MYFLNHTLGHDTFKTLNVSSNLLNSYQSVSTHIRHFLSIYSWWIAMLELTPCLLFILKYPRRVPLDPTFFNFYQYPKHL